MVTYCCRAFVSELLGVSPRLKPQSQNLTRKRQQMGVRRCSAIRLSFYPYQTPQCSKYLSQRSQGQIGKLESRT